MALLVTVCVVGVAALAIADIIWSVADNRRARLYAAQDAERLARWNAERHAYYAAQDAKRMACAVAQMMPAGQRGTAVCAVLAVANKVRS